MSTFEIPLSAQPQTLTVKINGTNYQLRIQWNIPMDGWVIDISDANGVAILAGVPLVTGANLLGQYEYLGFDFELFCQTDGDIYSPPTYENLGSSGHLYFTVSP